METNNKYIMNKYIILWDELLGKGSSADVYKCKDISDNYYAIKIISKKNLTPKSIKMLINETSILRLLKSEYIINLIDYYENEENYYLILDLADEKFMDIINTIDGKEIFNYLKQLIKCLIYIQSLKVSHNDIKPANILIHKNRLKLCDFGMSADIDDNYNFFCGSPYYMSLERLTGNFKVSSDFWAVKIIYYYMVYGTMPYTHSKNIKELILEIKNGIKYPYVIEQHTDILKNLFNNILLTPQDLLMKIESIENNFIYHYAKKIITPYKEFSLFLNVSSVNNDDCDRIIDEEFSDFLLLE